MVNPDWSQMYTGHDHTIALRSDGTLWAWGFNAAGELGLGDTNPRHDPVQIGSDAGWITVMGGTANSPRYDPWRYESYVLALKSDGTLWQWGHLQGYLGLPSEEWGVHPNALEPIQAGGGFGSATIIHSGYFVMALKTDGTLWGWGSYVTDFLYGWGFETSGYYSVPTQIGSSCTSLYKDWADYGPRYRGECESGNVSWYNYHDYLVE
jgi:alpha-tubulin suppressor-like RCC1 family protein